MRIPIYQVDAFTDSLFSGNPAAVCPLESWLPDDLLQNIASENNLSETAFIVKEANHYRIRWFTPGCEVDLCGHATLASAHVMFTELNHIENKIKFQSRSGELVVTKTDSGIVMSFPSDSPASCDPPEGLLKALGVSSRVVMKGITDYLVVLDSHEAVARVNPDFKALNVIGARGVIVTGPSSEYDFVSRFFAPGVGIDEDPVTGSAHTTLAPYWSEQTGKLKLKAKQISRRGGIVGCSLIGDRVELEGQAVTYSRGEISLP